MAYNARRLVPDKDATSAKRGAPYDKLVHVLAIHVTYRA